MAGPWPPGTVATTAPHGQNFYDIGGNLFAAPQAVAASFPPAPPPATQQMVTSKPPGGGGGRYNNNNHRGNPNNVGGANSGPRGESRGKPPRNAQNPPHLQAGSIVPIQITGAIPGGMVSVLPANIVQGDPLQQAALQAPQQPQAVQHQIQQQSAGSTQQQQQQAGQVNTTIRHYPVKGNWKSKCLKSQRSYSRIWHVIFHFTGGMQKNLDKNYSGGVAGHHHYGSQVQVHHLQPQQQQQGQYQLASSGAGSAPQVSYATAQAPQHHIVVQQAPQPQPQQQQQVQQQQQAVQELQEAGDSVEHGSHAMQQQNRSSNMSASSSSSLATSISKEPLHWQSRPRRRRRDEEGGNGINYSPGGRVGVTNQRNGYIDSGI